MTAVEFRMAVLCSVIHTTTSTSIQEEPSTLVVPVEVDEKDVATSNLQEAWKPKIFTFFWPRLICRLNICAVVMEILSGMMTLVGGRKRLRQPNRASSCVARPRAISGPHPSILRVGGLALLLLVDWAVINPTGMSVLACEFHPHHPGQEHDDHRDHPDRSRGSRSKHRLLSTDEDDEDEDDLSTTLHDGNHKMTLFSRYDWEDRPHGQSPCSAFGNATAVLLKSRRNLATEFESLRRQESIEIGEDLENLQEGGSADAIRRRLPSTFEADESVFANLGTDETMISSNIPHPFFERHLRNDGGICGMGTPTDREARELAVVQDTWNRRLRRIIDQGLPDDPSGNTTSYHERRSLIVATKAFPIRVYWHIMHKGSGTKPHQGMYHDIDIENGMEWLNKKFENTPFEFVLAGITRTRRRRWFDCTFEGYEKEYEYKSALRQPGKDVLNIYMCDLLNAQGYWGYAWYPNAQARHPVYDGVVIASPYVDGYSAEDINMVLIHEVGHWMGLYHSFHKGCQRGDGDGVRDTPAHVDDSEHYRGWRTCFDAIQPPYNTCPDNKRRVDPGPDPVMNIMNYVETDCFRDRGHFTEGQVDRMIAQFMEYRYSECRDVDRSCNHDVECCTRRCRRGKCRCKSRGRRCVLDQQCCSESCSSDNRCA